MNPQSAAAAFTPGMHGTTFGGGPLACAVAITVIDTIRQTQMLAHVTETGSYFKSKLESLAKSHDCITEVRGMGLMIGIELNSTELAERVAEQMMQRRIIINRTSDNVLRFLPPYILERKHVDLAITALEEILNSSAAHSASLTGEHANG